jgi:hypothetical protein
MHISKIIMKPILRPPADISSSHADNANTGGVSCIAELRVQSYVCRTACVELRVQSYVCRTACSESREQNRPSRIARAE